MQLYDRVYSEVGFARIIMISLFNKEWHTDGSGMFRCWAAPLTSVVYFYWLTSVNVLLTSQCFAGVIRYTRGAFSI